MCQVLDLDLPSKAQEKPALDEREAKKERKRAKKEQKKETLARLRKERLAREEAEAKRVENFLLRHSK